MTYTFRQQLLDPKRYKYNHPTAKDKTGNPIVVYKSAYAMIPKYITVHNTANDAPAANESNYHNRADNHNSTSFHIAIDDKEVVQLLPFNRNGYHCGDGSVVNGGNRTSIGIEICYSKSGGDRYKKAEANAVHYIATLLKQFGWGINRVKQHWDWPNSKGYRKNCPHRIRDEKRWQSFLESVDIQLKALYAADKQTNNQGGKHPMNVVSKETLRKEAINEIKAAVADGRFTSPHLDVEKYDEETLRNFMLIALARRK